MAEAVRRNKEVVQMEGLLLPDLILIESYIM